MCHSLAQKDLVDESLNTLVAASIRLVSLAAPKRLAEGAAALAEFRGARR
jgi:hypothetical protein